MGRYIKRILFLGTTLLFMSTAGCGSESPEFSRRNDGGIIIRQPDYRIVGPCGWSNELQCNACVIEFNDRVRGSRCQ